MSEKMKLMRTGELNKRKNTPKPPMTSTRPLLHSKPKKAELEMKAKVELKPKLVANIIKK
jgi:hypothetical protein